MPSTNDFLDAITVDLKAKFPALKACEVRDGPFDLDELSRVAVQVPAMYVSCLGVPAMTNPGTEQADASMHLTVYVVTKSTPQLSKGAAARNLVDALLAYLPVADWGLTGLGNAGAITAENLYTLEVDKAGVALWSVSWRQINRMGTDIWDVTGVMPSELYVGLTPAVGPDNISEYDLVQ